MLTKFAPRAVTPPSPKSRHWTISTAAMTTAPAHGPSSTADSTPPSRWPEIGSGNSGKLTIWAAKTKADIVPISTGVRSPSCVRSLQRQTARPPAPTRPVAEATAGDSTASGMCMAKGPGSKWRSLGLEVEWFELRLPGVDRGRQTGVSIVFAILRGEWQRRGRPPLPREQLGARLDPDLVLARGRPVAAPRLQREHAVCLDPPRCGQSAPR